MARPRKTLENQKGNLTVAIREQKAAEEKAAADITREYLTGKPPKELRDKVAKDTWKRVIPDLLKIPVVCNLDRDNIIGYCNAWSQYVEAGQNAKAWAKDAKKSKSREDAESAAGLARIWQISQKDAAAEQRKYAALCGLDVNARLKIGTAQVAKEDAEIEGMFGDI